MTKQFKINIKNAQLAEAIHLGDLKKKIAIKKDKKGEEKEPAPSEEASAKQAAEKAVKAEATPAPVVEGQVPSEEQAAEAPKVKARSRSAFAGGTKPQAEEVSKEEEVVVPQPAAPAPVAKTALEIAEEKLGPVAPEPVAPPVEEKKEPVVAKPVEPPVVSPLPKPREQQPPRAHTPPHTHTPSTSPRAPLFRPPRRDGGDSKYRGDRNERGDSRSGTHPSGQHPPREHKPSPRPPFKAPTREFVSPFSVQKKASPEGLAKLQASQKERLGPTGRHISDFIKPPEPPRRAPPSQGPSSGMGGRPPRRPGPAAPSEPASADKKSGLKPAKSKDFKDFKPVKKSTLSGDSGSFDSRDRQGLRVSGDDDTHRRRRQKSKLSPREDAQTVRPTSLKIRLPISIKDFASELKLKASELIAKLFLQGTVVTLNDLLEDETTVQLLGQEFGCEVNIDTSEEQRIKITSSSIRDEIKNQPADTLILRPPVVTFMGHVDHGKTSLIDYIRNSNRVSQEAGAITQHIGAFKCTTSVGQITVLDTPGHEAFSAMRARGAEITDIVVLVVAGDEGMKQQTLEAAQHAKNAGVTIVVAINKSDKPNFNPENVYRQLAENELLPEAWGGQTITVNCSAVTGAGIPELLEMLALQAEVLELRANPNTRARGSVIESEMHKGMGVVATILVQNGTLKKGDAVVFDTEWARIKTMRDEFGKELPIAPPSTPVMITGLSGLPQAGQEFIVVKDEKEAREIAETRSIEKRTKSHLLTKRSMDSFLQQGGAGKKMLRLVLRADVQGSLEALKAALLKITSAKVDIDIVFTGVGEISESDVQLAAASKAVIIGFHNSIESHAENLAKEMGVEIRTHDVIYHAIDDVKVLMAGQLEKLAQEVARGSAVVLQTFKSSQVGVIAGCMVTDGTVHRNYKAILKRKGQQIWRGGLASLKRLKEDVREVNKGFECGIVLDGFTDVQPDDVIDFIEIVYITQEL